MDKFSIKNLFTDKPNLTQQEQHRLRVILDSEVVDQLLEKAEQDSLVARAALIKKLETLEKNTDSVLAKPVKNVIVEQLAFDNAKAALNQAHENLIRAFGESYGASCGIEAEKSGIRKALQKSSDPRLQDFVIDLSNRLTEVKFSLGISIRSERDTYGRLQTVVESNMEEVKDATQVIAVTDRRNGATDVRRNGATNRCVKRHPEWVKQ